MPYSEGLGEGLLGAGADGEDWEVSSALGVSEVAPVAGAEEGGVVVGVVGVGVTELDGVTGVEGVTEVDGDPDVDGDPEVDGDVDVGGLEPGGLAGVGLVGDGAGVRVGVTVPGGIGRAGGSGSLRPGGMTAGPSTGP